MMEKLRDGCVRSPFQKLLAIATEQLLESLEQVMTYYRIHKLSRPELKILDRIQVAARWTSTFALMLLLGWCFFMLIWIPVMTVVALVTTA